MDHGSILNVALPGSSGFPRRSLALRAVRSPVASFRSSREPFARDHSAANPRGRRFAGITHRAIRTSPSNRKKLVMKTRTLPSLLSIALATLCALPPAFSAVAPEPAENSAGHQLFRRGALPVQSAGPYVNRGTPRIQVSTKLGRPDVVLANGTWLYHQRTITGGNARGTLVVRFENGRVSELVLASPQVVAALRENPSKPLPAELVAQSADINE